MNIKIKNMNMKLIYQKNKKDNNKLWNNKKYVTI